MSSRKTITIENLKTRANQMLAAAENDIITTQFKQGIASMIEWSLHQANAYEGYRFLDSNDSEYMSPGYWRREYF